MSVARTSAFSRQQFKSIRSICFTLYIIDATYVDKHVVIWNQFTMLALSWSLSWQVINATCTFSIMNWSWTHESIQHQWLFLVDFLKSKIQRHRWTWVMNAQINPDSFHYVNWLTDLLSLRTELHALKASTCLVKDQAAPRWRHAILHPWNRSPTI